MGIVDDLRHEEFWVKHSIIFRNHPSGDSQNATEDTKIEKHCSVWGNFKVEEEVGVQNSSQDKDSRKWSRDESNESAVQQNQKNIHQYNWIESTSLPV